MNRRGFLGSILVACAAPAIVRADSLMRIVPLDTTIITASEMIRRQELTYAEWAENIDGGSMGVIIKLLQRTNNILDDMVRVEITGRGPLPQL